LISTTAAPIRPASRPPASRPPLLSIPPNQL
jgi:hypothetical protein